MLEEATVTCPFCWETITVLIDLSVPAQESIEDCQVCCQAMLISYTSVDAVITDLRACRADG